MTKVWSQRTEMQDSEEGVWEGLAWQKLELNLEGLIGIFWMRREGYLPVGGTGYAKIPR